tara:strand:- start:719 stop:1237 length:519 start_codon:yes stop_codon:yes gene_type:complete
MIYLASKADFPIFASRNNFSFAAVDPILSGALMNENFIHHYRSSFKNLNQREKESLLVLADSWEIEAGEIVLEAGYLSHQLYIIVEGSVAMTCNDSEITSLGVGDIFGESAFVNGEGELFSFVTEEETVLLTIDFSFIAKLARLSSYFAGRFGTSISECLSRKLEIFEAKLC